MPEVTVGEENSAPINIHYEDHGSGSTVMLIHGFPLSGGAWERQERALIAADHRVITYDRRGFGKSSQPSTGYDYDTFAADLNALVNALDIYDFDIAGHSMGGGEVVRYLGTYGSERVRRAVIVSGVPPYLLKTAETPKGVPQGVFDEIQQALTADRFAYFTEWNKNFFNLDETLGSRISPEVVRYAWHLAADASPPGRSHASQHGTRTSRRPVKDRYSSSGASRQRGPDTPNRSHRGTQSRVDSRQRVRSH